MTHHPATTQSLPQPLPAPGVPAEVADAGKVRIGAAVGTHPRA